MKESKGDIAYYIRVKKHLSKVHSKIQVKSFDEIFKRSNGAFPDLVYQTVSDFKYRKKLSRKYNGFKEISTIIPEANPAVFDWRFDHLTVKRLVKIIKSNKFSKIALFGVPSLYEPLSRLGIKVNLYDINPVIKSHFSSDNSVILADINHYNFNGAEDFDCVIMDPPWYTDQFRNWLKHASYICKKQGVIFTTLFHDLLRPLARKERMTILKLSKRIGHVKISKDAIGYITPLFEREIFNYLNIPIYTDWRKADLLSITKAQKAKWQLSTAPENNWQIFEIGTITVAIKTQVRNQNSAVLKVKYPYKGNDSLIKSVSARDLTKSKINVITSRNRGLNVVGLEKVIPIIKEIAGGIEKDTVLRKSKLSKAEKLEFNKILETILI